MKVPIDRFFYQCVIPGEGKELRRCDSVIAGENSKLVRVLIVIL